MTNLENYDAGLALASAATHTFADAAVVTLRCAAEGCTRWQTAQAKHLANLLAGGPWRCSDHKETTR